MMFGIAFAGVALVVFAVIGLWLLGGREPAIGLSDVEPAYFVALKYRGGVRPASDPLAPGVVLKWAVDADFAFLGARERYWDRFLLVAGGASGAMPVASLDTVEDAFVARLKLVRPPRPLLGVFRFLAATGIWAKPDGPVSTDLDAHGFRADVMPDKAQIATLLSRPAGYAPAMVNFLQYYDAARYEAPKAGATPVTGRVAYSRYGIVALQTVFRTGGRLAFFGEVVEVLRDARSGPTTGKWDDIAVMEYTAAHSILTMEQVERYVASLKHRDAGLARSVVIASVH